MGIADESTKKQNAFIPYKGIKYWWCVRSDSG